MRVAHEDHRRLAKVLRQHNHRLNFLLTYDNSPEVRQLYNWTPHVLEKEWNYTISRTDDQTKKTTEKGKRNVGKEIFIMNYDGTFSWTSSGVQLPLAFSEDPRVMPNLGPLEAAHTVSSE